MTLAFSFSNTQRRSVTAVAISFMYVLLASTAVFAAQTQAQAEQCKKDFGGKQLTEEQYKNRYEKSNCPGDKGGNCTYNAVGSGSGTYYNIRCSNKAGDPPAGGSPEGDPGAEPETGSCGSLSLNILKCDNTGGDPVSGLILQVINFLAVGVGIAVVGGIIWGGMMYASSNGDSNKTKQGISIIVNAVIGLLLFIFMYAILNFIVPGGLFN